MKKLAILVMALFLVSFVSALPNNYDKVYDADLEKITFNKKSNGVAEVSFTLEDYSTQCLVDCYATGTVEVFKKLKPFNQVDFYDKSNSKKNINKNLLYIKEEVTREYVEPIYVEVCGDDDCSLEVSGYETKSLSYFDWVLYDGKQLGVGSYEWLLKGQKDFEDEVDWVLSTDFGNLNEWAWWSYDWSNKIPIEIEERDGNNWQNYSVLLQVDYETDMNADFSDIRFLNGTDDGELGFYIENKTDSVMAYVWVMTDLVANSNTTINMYFNNSLANVSTSNLNDAFLVADDFNDASLDPTIWNTDTATEIGGVAKIEGTEYISSVYSVNSLTSLLAEFGYADVYVSAQVVLAGISQELGDGGGQDGKLVIREYDAGGGMGYLVSQHGQGDIGLTTPRGNQHNYSLFMNSTDARGSVVNVTGGVSTNSYTGVQNSLTMNLVFSADDQANGDMEIDYARLRHFAESEPYNYFSGILTPPIPTTVTITSPTATTYTSNVAEIEFELTGDYDTCWYSLDEGVTNITTGCLANITGITSVEGSNTWTVYTNDSLAVEYSDEVTFTVETPVVVETPSTEDTGIFKLFNSMGAGLGLFMIYLADSIPTLLIALLFVGIVVAIGGAIAFLINKAL